MSNVEDFLFRFEVLCGEFFINPSEVIEQDNIRNVIKSKVSNDAKITKLRKIIIEEF